ncbi:3-methyl-2-oxobutanoate hydroxymethyltransferase [Rothia sp. ZJ932]|uniref:3-methyl-2-oxobutanoate hydroxymethyltransferase n=1 Tax=Rothia sp. ZJ932 TaxID=2810516 RepID=UPI00351BFE65
MKVMSSTHPTAETTAPYGSGASASAPDRHSDYALDKVKKIRTVHLAQAKADGEKFAMLTCYDALTAAVFDAAGIETLLVGDSAGNNVLGHESTLTITVDQMIPLVAAVSSATKRAFVIADMPFGSYQVSPAQAVETAVRFMKEGGAHAVKMEASAYYAEHVRAVVNAGIPVVAHIGFTPQAEHALGGFRIQGRGDASAHVVEDAKALVEAGAFCVLLEMTTNDTATAVNQAIGPVPMVSIGAGSDATGFVLVWQDMMGLREGKMARFVKQYANLHKIFSDAARAYQDDIRSGAYPAPEHSFEV